MDVSLLAAGCDQLANMGRSWQATIPFCSLHTMQTSLTAQSPLLSPGTFILIQHAISPFLSPHSDKGVSGYLPSVMTCCCLLPFWWYRPDPVQLTSNPDSVSL